jgi:hypothetical protein
VLSASIVVLAMSGGVAAAAADTNSVLVVDKIAEVDFGSISGTRVGAVSRVWLTAQDSLHFASGGASDARAQQKLAAMVKADGAPEGFHSGRWKPVDGPREGGSGSWSVSLSTLKDFVRTQALLARQSVAVGGAGSRSLAMHDGTKLRELPERPVALQHEAKRARVCQVQERQRIVLRRLQRVRKAAECAPGQLPLEAEQSQRRVACVQGRLAARAGEAQRVARQRLAAHAATQGTRALSLSGVRGHAGYVQDVCGEGSRA